MRTSICLLIPQTYSEAGLEQSKLWPQGTLCITIAANIAETSILGFDACFPDSVIGFVADDSKCDVRFMKYQFETIKQHYRAGFTRRSSRQFKSRKALVFQTVYPAH